MKVGSEQQRDDPQTLKAGQLPTFLVNSSEVLGVPPYTIRSAKRDTEPDTSSLSNAITKQLFPQTSKHTLNGADFPLFVHNVLTSLGFQVNSNLPKEQLLALVFISTISNSWRQENADNVLKSGGILGLDTFCSDPALIQLKLRSMKAKFSARKSEETVEDVGMIYGRLVHKLRKLKHLDDSRVKMIHRIALEAEKLEVERKYMKHAFNLTILSSHIFGDGKPVDDGSQPRRVRSSPGMGRSTEPVQGLRPPARGTRGGSASPVSSSLPRRGTVPTHAIGDGVRNDGGGFDGGEVGGDGGSTEQHRRALQRGFRALRRTEADVATRISEEAKFLRWITTAFKGPAGESGALGAATEASRAATSGECGKDAFVTAALTPPMDPKGLPAPPPPSPPIRDLGTKQDGEQQQQQKRERARAALVEEAQHMTDMMAWLEEAALVLVAGRPSLGLGPEDVARVAAQVDAQLASEGLALPPTRANPVRVGMRPGGERAGAVDATPPKVKGGPGFHKLSPLRDDIFSSISASSSSSLGAELFLERAMCGDVVWRSLQCQWGPMDLGTATATAEPATGVNAPFDDGHDAPPPPDPGPGSAASSSRCWVGTSPTRQGKVQTVGEGVREGEREGEEAMDHDGFEHKLLAMRVRHKELMLRAAAATSPFCPYDIILK